MYFINERGAYIGSSISFQGAVAKTLVSPVGAVGLYMASYGQIDKIIYIHVLD